MNVGERAIRILVRELLSGVMNVGERTIIWTCMIFSTIIHYIEKGGGVHLDEVDVGKASNKIQRQVQET